MELERFDRSQANVFRNTAGLLATIRPVAEIDLLREVVELFVQCAQLRGIETPTPPAVEVAGVKEKMKLALIPQAEESPAFFAVRWSDGSRTAELNLYEYFKRKNIVVPQSEHWRVPVTLEQAGVDGPVLVLHLDDRTVGPTGTTAPAADKV